MRSVFGIPGSGVTLSLIDALEKRGIAFHLNYFEGSGVLMAATTGRLSGRAGVSLSIKGPGLANSVPGLAAAWFEAFPVVHLTEATPRKAPASQAHKRLNHEALVKAVSKGIYTLSGKNSALKGAFALAGDEEPGPVVLELVEHREASKPKAEPIKMKGHTDDILGLIRRSQRPMVLAGALAIRQGWYSHLNNLNIPVFSTASAKGVIDETLPQSAGVYTGAGAKLTPEFQLFPKTDLIVGLGLTAREVLATKPFSCQSVSIAAVQTPGHEGFSFNCSSGIEGVTPVLDALAQKEWGLDALGRTKEILRSYMTRDFLPGRVFELIQDHFPGGVRAIMDTGYFCTIGEHAWAAQRPDLCLLSGQGRYMGTGLPMAIGASLYDRTLPTIAFLGDGGVGMYLAEAKLAVRNKLPLMIILMSDNAFASIRTRAIKDGLTQSPLLMDGRSWVGCFAAMGISGTKAENIKELSEAMIAWNPENGPAFLEIVFDPDKYELMVKGIR
ncbi:MAG: thiamine pyrophosphate-binding protein [Deltaproteobacteria bacterium]|nr:thiamine pyrophosphate-binding protein [Deltaproteobacteria bacterium]